MTDEELAILSSGCPTFQAAIMPVRMPNARMTTEAPRVSDTVTGKRSTMALKTGSWVAKE